MRIGGGGVRMRRIVGGVRLRGNKAEALCEFRAPGGVTGGGLTTLIATAIWGGGEAWHSLSFARCKSLHQHTRTQVPALPTPCCALDGSLHLLGFCFIQLDSIALLFQQIDRQFNKVIYYVPCRWHINGQIHFCFSFSLSDLAELSSFPYQSDRVSINEVTHF